MSKNAKQICLNYFFFVIWGYKSVVFIDIYISDYFTGPKDTQGEYLPSN